jgi:hypothetical protein
MARHPQQTAATSGQSLLVQPCTADYSAAWSGDDTKCYGAQGPRARLRTTSTDIGAPRCYGLREARHACSRLPPSLPARRGVGLWAAGYRKGRAASACGGDHAAGARAGTAATSSSAAKTLAARARAWSFARVTVACAALLRSHRRLPVGSARTGRASLHLHCTWRRNDRARADPAQS